MERIGKLGRWKKKGHFVRAVVKEKKGLEKRRCASDKRRGSREKKRDQAFSNSRTPREKKKKTRKEEGEGACF